MSDSSKRPQIHEKASNLSAASSAVTNISDHNEHSIGVLHGISLPLGNQTSKTVSFDDDVEELNEFTMWGKERLC